MRPLPILLCVASIGVSGCSRDQRADLPDQLNGQVLETQVALQDRLNTRDSMRTIEEEMRLAAREEASTPVLTGREAADVRATADALEEVQAGELSDQRWEERRAAEAAIARGEKGVKLPPPEPE